eukprot:10450550-Alexandrium_andersonii.AAC.1
MQRGKVTGAAPANSEEFRRKIKVMGIAWEFVRLKYPTRAVFADLTDRVWSDYTDWLLGEDVFGLAVRVESSGLEIKPDWATLLSFELELRRQAFLDVNVKG